MSKEFLLKMQEDDKREAKIKLQEVLSKFNLKDNTPKEFLEENIELINEIGQIYSIEISAGYDNNTITIYFGQNPVLIINS